MLNSKWNDKVTKENVWTEYPRPQMRRKSCQILNGSWEYAITKSSRLPENYEGEILVPFSPETSLSGVNRQLCPDEYLHYRRTFKIEEALENSIWLLHFGAVDQSCMVYVNQEKVGGHQGGYLPFTLDITRFIKEENSLQVVVRDVTDAEDHCRGKQKLERGGMFYTAQSGIWQTVWLERVPKHYITELKITPDYDAKSVRIKVFTNKREANIQGEFVISLRGQNQIEGSLEANKNTEITIQDFKAWSPETPVLYTMKIFMGEDEVETYFAMRKVSIIKDERGILRTALNNKAYFFCGILDQGYWPEGLYTAPSDEAMQYDIAKMKSLGFNTIRKHIKIEPARWYYHCDKMGMLVWQDMINGGSRYHWGAICLFPNLFSWAGRHVRDDASHYEMFSREDERGRQEYYTTLKEMVRTLYNVPSIVQWSLFNEGWGQFDASKAERFARKLDSTRLIEETSGWFDQGGGDFYSIHNYWNRLKVCPRDRVVALTECGGYAWMIPEHSFGEDFFGYRKLKSKKEMTKRYERLIKEEILPNIRNGLSVMIYTQLSDVEDEVNGLLTYDRKVVKVNEENIKKANEEIQRKFQESIEK